VGIADCKEMKNLGKLDKKGRKEKSRIKVVITQIKDQMPYSAYLVEILIERYSTLDFIKERIFNQLLFNGS
jgi:hypothetical protein